MSLRYCPIISASLNDTLEEVDDLIRCKIRHTLANRLRARTITILAKKPIREIPKHAMLSR